MDDVEVNLLILYLKGPKKKGMVKSEHVNDCKCGSELTPKGTLEEVWLSLTGQYIYMYISYIYIIYMPYFEVQLPGNDMLPVALPKTTQTNYLQVCLPEFQTPVRVVKVISTPILGFAGKMFCLYHLRGLSSFLDFLWIISAVGKLPEISPQTPGIMFLSPSVDGGVAGGLCDVVQLVVGFLKVGDVDLVPLQHVLGQVEPGHFRQVVFASVRSKKMHFLWTSGIPPTQKTISGWWCSYPSEKMSQIGSSSQLLGK